MPITGLAMQEKGCHSLAEFILSVDKWFDCMNAGELLCYSIYNFLVLLHFILCKLVQNKCR